MRGAAIEIARRLGGPTDVLEPLLLGCHEDELTAYVTQIFEAQRSGKWDAFGAASSGSQSDKLTVLAPGADVAGFLSAHCPLLEASHLGPEDQTWAVWMMHSGYRLMSAGEGFEAYAEMTPGWESALASALHVHGIGRRRALSLVLAKLEALEKARAKPIGVKWYLERRIGDDGDDPFAALAVYANIGLMLDQGDDYDARYRMRDLYHICHRHHDDKSSFAELNAWFWLRDRTRPYPVPRHGRDTQDLLSDLLIWSEHIMPKHEETVAAFVDDFRSGSLDGEVVRRMRKAYVGVDRSYLVENKDDATRNRRPHLHVCRIHSLLDNIEHLSPTDSTTYL